MLGVKRLAMVAGLVVLGLAPAAAASAAAPSAQDTQYLQTIHQVNLSEVAEGKLAQQKATNQQVKDLATQFVTDHTQLDQAVQNTAHQAGVTLPNGPTSDQQAVINQLQGQSGTAFDTQWVTVELAGHQKAITVTETEINKGSDPAVKQLAQQALPVLQAHLESLQTLAQSLGIPVPSGTGTPSPGISSGSPSPGVSSGAPSPSESATTSPAPGTEQPTPGATGTPTPGATAETPTPGATGTPTPGATAETPTPGATGTPPTPGASETPAPSAS